MCLLRTTDVQYPYRVHASCTSGNQARAAVLEHEALARLNLHALCAEEPWFGVRLVLLEVICTNAYRFYQEEYVGKRT